jgi:hypothetical protein
MEGSSLIDSNIFFNEVRRRIYCESALRGRCLSERKSKIV